MPSVFAVLHVVKIIILIIALVLSLIYVSLAVIIQRPQTSLTLLTINVCIACILCACYWIIYNALEMSNSSSMRYGELCWFYSYTQNVSVCQVIYAFCTVSLDRCLLVMHRNNLYFKRRRWAIIFMSIQWVLGGLLPAPLWFFQTCGQFGIPWPYQLYKVIVVIIIPTAFTIILNGVLFRFTHMSTSRIQPSSVDVGLRNRDTRLLKHIVFIIAVYVGSWAPIYFAALADVAGNFPPIVYGALSILPNVGLVIGTVDLFFYNNDVKRILLQFLPSQIK